MDSLQSIEYARQFGDKFYRSKHRSAICANCGTVKVLIMKRMRKQQGEAYWRMYYPANIIGRKSCELHDWRVLKDG